MIPNITWETKQQRPEWDPNDKTYKKVDFPGRAIMAYLSSKKEADQLKLLHGIKDTKFKARFGLRKGPLLVIFIQKDLKQGFKDAPIVIDNNYIKKWSGGTVNSISEIITTDILFYVVLKGKFQCDPNFKPLLNMWLKKHLSGVPKETPAEEEEVEDNEQQEED